MGGGRWVGTQPDRTDRHMPMSIITGFMLGRRHFQYEAWDLENDPGHQDLRLKVPDRLGEKLSIVGSETRNSERPHALVFGANPANVGT